MACDSMLGPGWKMSARTSRFFYGAIGQGFGGPSVLLWQQALVKPGFDWVVTTVLFHYLVELRMDPTACVSC